MIKNCALGIVHSDDEIPCAVEAEPMKLTEKQKLLKRLKGFCVMLGDKIESLDANLRAQLEDVIRRLESPTKIVVAGLSGSGHHQLAEFFLGTDLFDDPADAKTSPRIDVRFGKMAKTRATFGGKRKVADGISLSTALAGTAPDSIELEVPNRIAEDVGFTILPVYDGGDDRPQYLVNLLDDTEVIIWCSSALMPWQPAERRLWFTIPDTLKQRSILVLTEADGVTSDESNQRFDDKCALVEDDFHWLGSIAIPAAKAATTGGRVADANALSESGGGALLKTLMTLVQADKVDLLMQARALRAEIDKIPLGSAEQAHEMPASVEARAATALPKSQIELPEAKVQVVEPVTAELSTNERISTSVTNAVEICQAALSECGENDFAPLFDAIDELLKPLPDLIRSTAAPEIEQLAYIAQIEEAAEMVGLLGYENSGKAAQEGADIVRQIVCDLWEWTCSDVSNDTPNLTDIQQTSAAG